MSLPLKSQSLRETEARWFWNYQPLSSAAFVSAQPSSASALAALPCLNHRSHSYSNHRRRRRERTGWRAYWRQPYPPDEQIRCEMMWTQRKKRRLLCLFFLKERKNEKKNTAKNKQKRAKRIRKERGTRVAIRIWDLNRTLLMCPIRIQTSDSERF